MEKNPKIIRDKMKYKIINDIWTLFETKKGKWRKKENEERKKKKHNDRINNHVIVRDIRTLFEQEGKESSNLDVSLVL